MSCAQVQSRLVCLVFLLAVAAPTWAAAGMDPTAIQEVETEWQDDFAEAIEEPTQAALSRDGIALTQASFPQFFDALRGGRPFVTVDCVFDAFGESLRTATVELEARSAARLRAFAIRMLQHWSRHDDDGARSLAKLGAVTIHILGEPYAPRDAREREFQDQASELHARLQQAPCSLRGLSLPIRLETRAVSGVPQSPVRQTHRLLHSVQLQLAEPSERSLFTRYLDWLRSLPDDEQITHLLPAVLESLVGTAVSSHHVIVAGARVPVGYLIPTVVPPWEPLLEAITLDEGVLDPSGLDLLSRGTLASSVGVSLRGRWFRRSTQSTRIAHADASTPTSALDLAWSALGLMSRDPAAGSLSPFRTEVWRDLCCNTQLGGMAKLLIAAGPHVKTFTRYRSVGGEGAPGIVSPHPEVFEGIAAACEVGLQSLEVLDTLAPFDERRAAAELEAHCKDALEDLRHRGARLSDARADNLEFLLQLAELHVDTLRREKSLANRLAPTEVLEALQSLAERARTGPRPSPRLRAVLHDADTRLGSARRKFQDTAKLARELAHAAREQLQGNFSSEGQTTLFRDFGQRLATVFGYRGDTWQTPRDDYPDSATLARWDDPNGRRWLDIGLDRPAEVLLEIEFTPGRRVRYRGAVFAYRESSSRADVTGSVDPVIPARDLTTRELVGSRAR